jgi:PIN domain nuclease of toxin-antitoxin system
MRLLLDTHVLLWTVQNELPSKMRDAIGNPLAALYISFASLWEMEIKKSLAKLEIPPDFYLLLNQANITLLPISIPHIQRIGDLPRHHGDPFDRMIIAQAQAEGLTIVTHDKEFALYNVALL